MTTISDASILTGWTASSYSGANGDCVEVAPSQGDATPVRDSKAPTGPALLVPSEAWVRFTDAVRDGRL